MDLIGIRKKIDGNELDLSLMNLKQVPLEELSKCQIIRNLDLSNNKLVNIPFEFPIILCQITQLDLSKNGIRTIPENFGEIRNLLHLDLYSNKIETLPISFAYMKKLRWLDVKDNPLVPNLAKICGNCSNDVECKASAKRLVSYMGDIVKQVEAKHQSTKENKENVEVTDDESGKDNAEFQEEPNDDVHIFKKPFPKAKKGGKKDKGGAKAQVKQVVKQNAPNNSDWKGKNDGQFIVSQNNHSTCRVSRYLMWFLWFISLFIIMDAVYFEIPLTKTILESSINISGMKEFPLHLDFLFNLEARIKEIAQRVFI